MRFVPGVVTLALLVAGSARADIGVPDPIQSSVEPTIVGCSSGMLIGDGFRITVRDRNGNPLNGVAVDLSFAGTAVRPYDSQVAPSTSICATRTIRQATSPFGLAVFQPRLGGYENATGIPVRANGILLGNASARSTDIDGNGATDIADFAVFRANFLLSPAHPSTDYDESDVTDVADFDIFRRVFLFDVPGSVCP